MPLTRLFPTCHDTGGLWARLSRGERMPGYSGNADESSRADE